MKTYFRKPRDDRLHQPAYKEACRVSTPFNWLAIVVLGVPV